MGDDEFRHKFIGGLTPDNQVEVCHIGINKSVDNIFSELEEVERYKIELLTGAGSYYQTTQPSYSAVQSSQTYSAADIEKIINSRLEEMKKVATSRYNPMPSPSYRDSTGSNPSPTSQGMKEARNKLFNMAYRLGME